MPRIFLVNILYREVSTAEGSSAIYDATLLMVKEHVGGDEKTSERTRGPLHSSLNCVLITREITDRRRQQKFLLLLNKNMATRIKIGGNTWGALKTWGRFSQSVFITIASDRKAL